MLKNTKEIKEKFIKEGWDKNINFSELTLQEAKEKGCLFAIWGIEKGEKYFILNENGNIYDSKGKIACYNIKSTLIEK